MSEPGSLQYQPGAHSSHIAAPLTLNRPAGQIVCVGECAASGQMYPALQLPHDDEPLVLNRPAGHDCAVAMTAPPVQMYPAAHSPLHDGDVRPGEAP